MAKVLFTAIVADMRNKLNGTVFSRNSSGAYVRTKVTPVNPQTPDQTIVRQRLGALSAQWRGLTDAERASWTAAAQNFPRTDQFGNTVILAGSALYVSMNTNLLTVASATIATAPAPAEIPEFIIFGVVADASVPTLTITYSLSVPSGFNVVVQATPQVSAGKSFVKNLYRQIQVDSSGAGTSAIIANYTAKFGALAAGQRIGLRVFLVNEVTGQAGVPSEMLVDVVP